MTIQGFVISRTSGIRKKKSRKSREISPDCAPSPSIFSPPVNPVASDNDLFNGIYRRHDYIDVDQPSTPLSLNL
uniref:Uncharacterized protein n=1 Tax=Panagrolaimus sp. JU765 TaxID=591449 RepID=A0AC34RNW0_9BILA